MAKLQKKLRQQSRAAVVEILRVTKKTQKQFAEDIGEDAGVVRQWTMKSNPREVPSEYRRRIAAAYGAEWDDNGNLLQAGSPGRNKFTKKSYNGWRGTLISRWEDRLGFPRYPKNTKDQHGNLLPLLTKKQNGEPFGKYALEGFLISKASDVLYRTLAAAENRRGDDNHRRLFAVIESFNQWSKKIVKDFKLENQNEIQDFYRVTTLTKEHKIQQSTGRKKYISMMETVTAPPRRSDLDAQRWNGKP